MGDEGSKVVDQDFGRADYVPEGQRNKYARKFADGTAVWMKVSKSPDIVVYVKEASYEESEGHEYWAYKVQEKDKDGAWCGVERWKKETALKRA